MPRVRAAYVFGRQRTQKRKATRKQRGAVSVFATRGREQRIVNVSAKGTIVKPHN